MPNLKFLAFTVPEILGIRGGSQNSKSGSRDPHMTPFDLILHFLSLLLTAIHLCAKFEISSFKHPRNIRGVPKIQNWVKWSPTWPLLTLFCILSLVLTAIHLCAKFEVSSFYRSGDIRGSPKFQKWVTWPPHDPFWPNFAFFSLVLTAIHLCA